VPSAIAQRTSRSELTIASFTCAEATQRFQALRSEMTGIAQKIGEIESEGEEHR
jgi:hypothetical protein